MEDIQIVAKYPLLLIVLVLGTLVSGVKAATREDVEASMQEAYRLIAVAESSGGDVSALIPKLNQAAALVRNNDADSLARALNLTTEVMNSAVAAGSAGAQSVFIKYVTIWVTLVVLGVAGILVYLYGSRLFWRLWLWSKRGWRAELA